MTASRLDEHFQPTPIEDEAEHARLSVNINGGQLRSELERVPADLAHYGFGFARAHRRWQSAKIALKEIEAATALAVRQRAEDLGDKLTEAGVAAKVQTHANVRQANAELIEAEFERAQMSALTEAVRTKREALTSLVMLARAEMGGASWRDPSEDSDGK